MILRHRPVVKFDPSNYDHRKAVKNFMKRNSWSDSELRFSNDPAFGSIAEQVKTKLLEWYIHQEN